MGIMIGMFSILPTIDMQAAFGLIMLCASVSFTVNADVEGFAMLLIIVWWIRYIYLITQYLLSHRLDKGGGYCQKHPPWPIQHHVYQMATAMDM